MTVRVNLDTTGTEADLFDTNPGQDFPLNCSVRIYDASASPPFSVSEVQQVVEVGDDYLMLDDAPSTFTMAAGDLVVLENSAETGNTNAAGGDVQDHLFQANDSDVIDSGGPTARTATVWA